MEKWHNTTWYLSNTGIPINIKAKNKLFYLQKPGLRQKEQILWKQAEKQWKAFMYTNNKQKQHITVDKNNVKHKL